MALLHSFKSLEGIPQLALWISKEWSALRTSSLFNNILQRQGILMLSFNGCENGGILSSQALKVE